MGSRATVLSTRLGRATLLLLVAVLGGGLGLVAGCGMCPQPTTEALAANSVRYRYRFGGDVVTHLLPNVAAVTLYRTSEAVDQVVFNLENGHNYVLNADVLVDYLLPADGSVERREVLNELYHHYDPYLQAEKQTWRREWTYEQFARWVGRPPSEQEWLEVLNELTRGVDYRQMERWIQYSPQACNHYVQERFQALVGREPSPEELRFYGRGLLAGQNYEDVEREIAGVAAGRDESR